MGSALFKKTEEVAFKTILSTFSRLPKWPPRNDSELLSINKTSPVASLCLVMFDDLHIASECTFEHVGNAFGLAGVERGRITAIPTCICNDRRRARADFKACLSFGFDLICKNNNVAKGRTEIHVDRQASSECTLQYMEHPFGLTGIKREPMLSNRQRIWIGWHPARANVSIQTMLLD